MSQPLHFEKDGLYILLFDIGNKFWFDWQMYLTETPESGKIYRIINPDPTNLKVWSYETEPDLNMIDSSSLLVAVKLTPLAYELHEALDEQLASISLGRSSRFRENMSSRVWVKEVLYKLGSTEFIELSKTIERIELEARSEAMRNKHQKKRSLIEGNPDIL